MTEVAEGTKLEIPVLLASFYGLRRSEVLGLKWDAIDFEENTLEIKHIVTQASIDGKKVLVQADRAKTKSSLRTLPLVPPIRDRLLMLKGQQETYRRLCGKSYNRIIWAICVWTGIGNIVSRQRFRAVPEAVGEKNGLRPIRFHDLRRQGASLSSGKRRFPASRFRNGWVTSDFLHHCHTFTHLDYASSSRSAQAMLERLGYGSVSMMPYAHKTRWTGDVPAKKNGQTNKIHLPERFGGHQGVEPGTGLPAYRISSATSYDHLSNAPDIKF